MEARGSLPLKDVVAELASMGVSDRDEICSVLYESMAAGLVIESRNTRSQVILMLTALGFQAFLEGRSNRVDQKVDS